MYMSYCRYEGTRNELNACMEDVREHVNMDAEYPVSDREIRCFKDMVYGMTSWLYEMDLIDEEGELNESELENICEAMAKGYNRED